MTNMPDPERVMHGMAYERLNPEPPEWLTAYMDSELAGRFAPQSAMGAIGEMEKRIDELIDLKCEVERLAKEEGEL